MMSRAMDCAMMVSRTSRSSRSRSAVRRWTPEAPDAGPPAASRTTVPSLPRFLPAVPLLATASCSRSTRTMVFSSPFFTSYRVDRLVAARC